MKINSNITITGADIGASYTTLTSWDPQPAGAGDGDYYILSGSVYRYHSTYDCLVRPVLYKQTNKYLDAHITGSEANTAALQASGFPSAPGTFSSADGWCTIPEGINYCIRSLKAPTAVDPTLRPALYYAGYVKSVVAPSADYAGVGAIIMGTQTGHFGFVPRMTSGGPDAGFVKYTIGDMNFQTTPSGSTFDLTVSDPPWVEIYLPEGITDSYEGGAMAWIGHSKIPVKVSGGAAVSFGGTNRWLVGDGTGNNASIALKTSWFIRANI
jgi:hypothetical protein